MDRPTAPANPREPALGLLWAVALDLLCGLGTALLAQRGATGSLVGWLRFSELLLNTVIVVVGAVWARRCWRNAEAIAPDSQPFRLGWTTAGWVIPGVSLWMTWRILLGLWRTFGVRGTPLLVHLGGALSVLHLVTFLLPVNRWVLLATGAPQVVLFVIAIRRITARQFAVLDFPAQESWEAAVEADRAKISAN